MSMDRHKKTLVDSTSPAVMLSSLIIASGLLIVAHVLYGPLYTMLAAGALLFITPALAGAYQYFIDEGWKTLRDRWNLIYLYNREKAEEKLKFWRR